MMKKRTIYIFLIIMCLILVLCSCSKDSESDKIENNSTGTIAYLTKADEQITSFPGIGAVCKVNDGFAMAGVMVKEDKVSLVLVGMSEATVEYRYNQNGEQEVKSEGNITYNNVRYFYSKGPEWLIKNVGDPFVSGNPGQIYAFRCNSADEMATNLLSTGDISKISLPMISTVDDLLGLANTGKSAILVNDIDLGGIEWTPIENFCGVLDGAGHKIKNVTMNITNGNCGLFNTLSGATVRDLVVEVNFTSLGKTGLIGGLCATASGGNITNVSVYGTINAMFMDTVGGIAGKIVAAHIENCTNYASVTAYEVVGGIAGAFESSVRSDNGMVQNNYNYGHITGLKKNVLSAYVGGIFGKTYIAPTDYKSPYSNDSSNWIYTIMNCANYGIVKSGGGYTGGILGGHSTSRYRYGASYVEISLANCKNEGFVYGEMEYVGGILGYTDYCRSIINCENKGNVSSISRYVGGISGSISPVEPIVMCKNYGDIQGMSYVGGIVGYTSQILTSCENNGKIVALSFSSCMITGSNDAAYVGGIAGFTRRYAESSNNYGTVISRGSGSYVGGIAGGMYIFSNDAVSGNFNQGIVITEAGGSYVGGIVGRLFADGTECIFMANNIGSVDAPMSDYVGGIAGCVDSTPNNYKACLILMNSKNSGVVKGRDYVAGLLGMVANIRGEDGYWATNENLGIIEATGETFADVYNLKN